jgi:hypothetical protein
MNCVTGDALGQGMHDDGFPHEPRSDQGQIAGRGFRQIVPDALNDAGTAEQGGDISAQYREP